MKRTIQCWLFVSGFLLLAGCGQSLKTHPVKGKVTFPDGKPVPGGRIEFRSEAAETKGLNARGEIDTEGNYTVSTFANGQQVAGAVAGPHKVIVMPPDIVVPSQLDKEPPPSPVPPRYRSYDSSGLEVGVEAGKADYPLTVARK